MTSTRDSSFPTRSATFSKESTLARMWRISDAMSAKCHTDLKPMPHIVRRSEIVAMDKPQRFAISAIGFSVKVYPRSGGPDLELVGGGVVNYLPVIGYGKRITLSGCNSGN